MKKSCNTHASTLAGVGVNHWLGMLVKGIQALFDGLDVVVNAAAGLTPLEKPLGHGFVLDIEIEDFGARADLLFKLFALCKSIRMKSK